MDIYSVLSSKPHNVHHLNRYHKFITACIENNTSLDSSVYTECHHICPKSKDLFPQYASFKDNPWNKIVLTAKQHYIAHLILSHVYSHIGAELFLIYRRTDCIHSSKKYEHVRNFTRKKASEQMKKYIEQNGHPKGMLGKTHSIEYKTTLKHSMIGNGNPMFGKKQPHLSTMNKDPQFRKENGERISKCKKHKKATDLGFSNYEQLLIAYKNIIEIELKTKLITLNSERKRLMYICQIKNISMKKLDGILCDLNIKLTNHFVANLQHEPNHD